MKKELKEIKNIQDFKIYLNYPRITDSGLFEEMRFTTCNQNSESLISWFKKENDLYQIRVSKECIKHIEKPRIGIGNLPMMCEDLRFEKSIYSRTTKKGEPIISIEILMPNELAENESKKNSHLTKGENIIIQTSKDHIDQSEKQIEDFFEDNFEPIRVNKYLKEKNISLKTLNALGEYTHQNKFSLNSKLSEETLNLLNKIILTEEFNNWLHTKFTYEKAKIDNAEKLIENLTYGTKIDNNIIGIEVSETKNKRILNALKYLIDIEYYNDEKKNFIKEIINSEKVLKTKVHQLKKYFHKQPNENSKLKITESEQDPFENFHWGGLSGEEAHTAYWNCD